jgi:phage shock protein PspC (stress-responsive transcriptional regulator)
MKKIININLSGRVVPIEDAAYESLQRYIESLRRYFAHEEGRDEIINDIESRIAELMSDKIKKGASAVTEADVEEIITSMGRVEDFEEAAKEEDISAGTTTTGSSTASGTFTKTEQQSRRAKGRLYRDSSDKLLGGVCSGIANYMNVDPAIVRLLFAIITFGGFGAGIPIYILLWIILPVRDLDTYVGKRLFRNPEDKMFSGVAGGLAAYFNKPSWMVRLVFAAPLVLNIVFGTLNGIFFAFHRDIFPNLLIGSFTGTFILAYIILWIVLPEARSSFEKMEMRGEKVDVNRIRQNVKDEMENFKTRAQAWGEEVKISAQEFGEKAKEFANTRGRAFAGEVSQTARPVAHSMLRIIGVIFKAFFIFVAGCIALSLFAGLIVLIFGGVAWWPINNFLWTSRLQEALAWGTVLFFIGVPVVGFMTWLIRRVVRVRSKSGHLSWIFSGLWLIGWVCAIMFAISIVKDLRSYEKTAAQEIPVSNKINKLEIRVNEPEIRYSGNFWWMRDDNTNWDITEDSMRYSNVKVRLAKSEDSFYHVRIYRYSAGKNSADAQQRASRVRFNVASQDSVLNIGSGITVDAASKFRGQGLIVEILVPAGKKVRIDQSVADAYNPWVMRTKGREYGRYSRRNYNIDWDNDEYFDWNTNVDYVLTTDGKFIPADKAITTKTGVFERPEEPDTLKKADNHDTIKGTQVTGQTTTQVKPAGKNSDKAFAFSPFAPLII